MAFGEQCLQQYQRIPQVVAVIKSWFGHALANIGIGCKMQHCLDLCTTGGRVASAEQLIKQGTISKLTYN